MSYQSKTPWSFVKPTTCTTPEKLFALETPYTGKRINKAKLVRKLTEKDKKVSRALSAMGDPIPESWSWRKLGENDPKYKGKIEPARDQGGCGSCWAFSLSAALSDRYVIKYGIEPQYLSPTWLMSKTYDLMEVRPAESCNEGGDPHMASKWLETNGTKEEKCWPYSLIKQHSWVSPNELPSECCATCCDPEIATSSQILYSVQPESTRTLAVISGNTIDKEATVTAIQREIMSNGPVVCGFQVFDDFSTYWAKYAPNGDIYVTNARGDSGGHAVTLTGWGVGEINGEKVRYWEMRNSWGNSGDNGYGRIAFSTDVPRNSILQVDVPAELDTDRSGNVLFSGGTFAFTPGAKPNLENYAIRENFEHSSDDKCSTKFMGLNMHISIIILIIIAVIMVIGIISVLIIKKR